MKLFKYLLLIIICSGAVISGILAVKPEYIKSGNIYNGDILKIYTVQYDVIADSFIRMYVFSVNGLDRDVDRHIPWIYIKDISSKYDLNIDILNGNGLKLSSAGETVKPDYDIDNIFINSAERVNTVYKTGNIVYARKIDENPELTLLYGKSKAKKPAYVVIKSNHDFSKTFENDRRFIMIIIMSLMIAAGFGIFIWDPERRTKKIFRKI